MIQEKTQEEHVVKPVAAPRRTTCTITSATQTDPVREDTSTTVLEYSAAPQSAKKRPAGETWHKNNMWQCKYVTVRFKFQSSFFQVKRHKNHQDHHLQNQWA